jgi:hypothetical protein
MVALEIQKKAMTQRIEHSADEKTLNTLSAIFGASEINEN